MRRASRSRSRLTECGAKWRLASSRSRFSLGDCSAGFHSRTRPEYQANIAGFDAAARCACLCPISRGYTRESSATSSRTADAVVFIFATGDGTAPPQMFYSLLIFKGAFFVCIYLLSALPAVDARASSISAGVRSRFGGAGFIGMPCSDTPLRLVAAAGSLVLVIRQYSCKLLAAICSLDSSAFASSRVPVMVLHSASATSKCELRQRLYSAEIHL